MMFQSSLKLIIFVFISASVRPALAISCGRLDPSNPSTKTRIANDKYSPFEPMILASFAGAITTGIAFAPDESSPDHDRKSIKTIGSIATFSWIASGSLYVMTSACGVSREIKEQVGPVTKLDVDPDILKYRRTGFMFFYTLNTLPSLLYALDSKRDERWAIFGITATLPALVDLTSRYVFESEDVSPWTLTSTLIESDRDYAPVLAFRRTW